jgi:hypothetical protein
MLRSNEKLIDFFLSHSWHDDPAAKSAAVDLVKDRFKAANGGREPTFWLDKVCIDQSNISEGLKVLCINVTACNKLLVVCGKTYFQRLWCILELFMMFAFADEEDAVARIELVPIEADGVTRTSILESMAHFKLADAHCYDPNEEIKLRGVMSAVGEEKFVGRIRSLAGKIRARDLKEKAPGISNPFPKRRMSLMAVASSTISSARSIGHSLSSRSPIRSLHSLASTPEAEI